MTKLETTAEERGTGHWKWENVCNDCGTPWPCLHNRICRDIDTLIAERDAAKRRDELWPELVAALEARGGGDHVGPCADDCPGALVDKLLARIREEEA